MAATVVAVLAGVVPTPLLASAGSPTEHVPAVAIPTGAVSSAGLDDAADVSQPAVRLRALSLVNFPMATSPRCQILDNFGEARGSGRIHEGSDMLATRGQEVYAMANGTLTLQVVAGSAQNGASLSGNLWKLTADLDGTYFVYAHLDAFAPGLARGSVVFQGQLLGWVGDTGNPGPGNYHLHFEIHPGGGAAVNPLPLLTIPDTCTVS